MYDYGTARPANTSSKQVRHTHFSSKKRFNIRKKSVHNIQKQSTTKERNKSIGKSGYLRGLQIFLISLLLIAVVGYLLFTKVIPQLVTFEQSTNLLLIRQDGTENQFYFIHFNPDTNLNYIAKLDNQEQISIPFLETTVSLKDTYQILSNLEDNNPHVMISIYSHLLGLIIDDVIVVTDTLEEETKGSAIFTHVFDKNVQIPFQERFNSLKYYLYAYKDEVVIKKTQSIRQVARDLSDNQTIWRKENVRECPIAVVNATSTNGLALSYSTSIEKSGGFIIRVSSSSTLKDKSGIYTNGDPACTNIENDIKHLFPQKIETVTDTNVTDQYRASIVLYLGSDSYQMTD